MIHALYRTEELRRIEQEQAQHCRPER